MRRMVRVSQRPLLVSAAGFVALVLVTQVLLPGGGEGRGTPAAILAGGVVGGLLDALTAAGIILVYRSIRVVNFAQTAIGAFGGELCFQLLLRGDVPFLAAFGLGVIGAGLAGVVFELVIGRRFARAPRLVLTVATIAVAGLLAAISRQAVEALPFLSGEDPIADQLAAISLREELPFSTWSFTIGSLPLPFGFAEVFAVAAAVVTLVGVASFLRFTRAGTAVRALAENADRAALLGISTAVLALLVWAIAGVLSGVGVILTGFVSSPEMTEGVAPAVLLPALAAAVIARMQSMPIAVAAAVGIAWFDASFSYSFRDHTALIDVVLFGIVSGGLFLQGRAEEGRGSTAATTWEATEEQRPVPRELLDVPGVRLTRFAFVAIGLLAVLVYPFVVSTRAVVLGAVIALFTVLALSVLVLTGWAGQVSLGQFAIAAIGGVVAGSLTGRVGLSFWLAVPLATLVTAAVSALIGLPALRIRGLFLAVSTFALAIAVRSTLFDPRWFGGLLPERVDRPTLVVFDFEDETSMYVLCLLCLVLAVVVVANLRRSRTGRVLIAVRENDADLSALGVSALRAKILAFTLSGALAGFAGAVFVHLQRGISPDSFVPQRSIDLFLLAVLGGVTSIPGVLLGSIAFNAQQFFLSANPLWAFVQPFAVIVLLYVEPGGLIGLINRGRDSALRIVAQRRQLIVPSLFAGVEPEDLAARLIPLAEPQPGSGLDALPPSGGWVLASELYEGAGQPLVTPRVAPRRSKEAELLGAAAEAVSGEGR